MRERLSMGAACGAWWMVWLAASVGVGQEPSPEIRVARLVKQLGSSAYELRTSARDELARLGPTARQQLEKAIADPEPEVRIHAKDLLKQLKLDELWAPRLVSLPAGKQPVSKLLEAVAEQSGNRLLMGDQYGTFHDQPIDWNRPRVSFWEAVDELCRQSGNRVRPTYDSRQPGLVVVAAKESKFPLASNGPVRAQITSARRDFAEDLDYETLASEKTHKFQFGLQLMWEDRVHVVAYRSQPELTSATTDTGQQLGATQAAGGAWNVASGGARQVSMTLRLQPPATSATRLKSLKLRWGLIAVGDPATLEVPAVADKQPHFQDDVELVVESIDRKGGALCEVELLLTRGLVIPDP